MSFLDKIKTDDAPATAKPNPLAKPNPFAKKKVVEEAPKDTAPAVVPVVIPTAEKKKTLPFSTPLESESKTEEVVAKKVNPFGPKPKVAEETTPVVLEVAAEETEKLETIPVETVEPETAAVEPTVEVVDNQNTEEIITAQAEVVATPEKKTRKGRGGNTAAAVKKEESANDNSERDAYSMPTTSMEYGDAILSIKSPFVDEEWEAFRGEIQVALDAITISADMNSSTLKKTISDLSALRQRIWMSYQDTRNLYDSLCSREPEGLIERIKKTAFGKDDKNDMERKKVGIEACMEYSTTSGCVNLYEVLDETRSRYNFLRAVMDSVEWKTSSLITMNGAIKLENNHISKEA